MGFKDAKIKFIRALKDGEIQHESRDWGKNWLAEDRKRVFVGGRTPHLGASSYFFPSLRKFSAMKIRVPGEKTKVACEQCRSLQPGTWNYGTFDMSDGTAIEQVMLAYCDVCGAPCSMAHQSSWRLREAREEREKIRTSFRISLPLFDLTAGKISEIGGDAKRAPEIIARALLRRLCREPERIPTFASDIKELKSPLLERPSKKMNLRLAPGCSKILEQLKEATSLNQSEILRRALVISDSDPQFTEELKSLVEPTG